MKKIVLTVFAVLLVLGAYSSISFARAASDVPLSDTAWTAPAMDYDHATITIDPDDDKDDDDGECVGAGCDEDDDADKGDEQDDITDDADGDGFIDDDDNCPDDHNPDQLDSDDDGVGDACDFDMNLGALGPAPHFDEAGGCTIASANGAMNPLGILLIAAGLLQAIAIRRK